MFKRMLAVCIAALMLLCFGCAAPDTPADAEKPGESVTAGTDSAAKTPEVKAVRRSDVLGFIIEDDGAIGTYMAMHGFLRTAENLGYPASLFRAKNGAEAEAAVLQAVEAGCSALLISNPGGVNDAAVKSALSAGLKVAVPYDKCGVEGLHANIVADDTDYIEELARGIATRMEERSLKSGRILLYGRNNTACLAAFSAAIEQYYPKYTVVSFTRTTEDDELAVAELAEYLLYNRDIKGLYVVDADSASVAVRARSSAQAVFRKKGTPSPTPTLPLTPEATPEPTPNPGLLTAIIITAFANGLSDENYALFNDSDIYALCIEPYYEAAAQATMILDQLVSGADSVALTKVNRPIAYADTIEKYKAIFDQMKEMFGLNTPAPTESPLPAE